MTDRDFARIQAAFPALSWHWATPTRVRGDLPPAGGLSVTVEHYGRIVVARILVRGTIVWQHTSSGGSLVSTLAAARTAIATLHDDLTAVIGATPSAALNAANARLRALTPADGQ